MQDGFMPQDQDEDIPRLRSFTGPAAAADDLSSKASKKKKRDPSPLSRMGSSLLRPFKGLSKLRTSRSSDKGGKLQSQSRTAPHTDSLASRATSASTQDTGGPSRIGSASLQSQVQTLQGSRTALEPSDSFHFKRTPTDDGPDLTAEPSFAQDLPQNKRSGPTSSISQAKPAVSSHSGGVPAASVQSLVAEQPASLSSSSLQSKAGGAGSSVSAIASAAAVASDSDDEFDYDFSQPSTSQRSTAAAATAAMLQPKVTSTSSAQPQAAASSGSRETAGSAGRGLPDEGGGKAAGSLIETRGVDAQKEAASSSVQAGKLRPQLSRVGKPQLTIATTSVYSPLESGAATSPTMRASAHADSQDSGLKSDHEPQSGLLSKAAVQQTSQGQQSTTELVQMDSQQMEIMSGSSATAAKDAQSLARPSQLESRVAPAGTDNGTSHMSSAVQGSLSGPGITEDDPGSSPDLSSESSRASSEFDLLEDLPESPNQQPSRSNHAAPASPTTTAQGTAEAYTVQRSAYSDTPILGPSPSQLRQPVNASTAVAASSVSMTRPGTAFPQTPVLHNTQQQTQLSSEALLGCKTGILAASTLPVSPRRGFSDKPILAVYSRRPSTDGEATTGSSNQASEQALQTKVNCHASLATCTCVYTLIVIS